MIGLVDLDLSGNQLDVLDSDAVLPYSQLNCLSLAKNQLRDPAQPVPADPQPDGARPKQEQVEQPSQGPQEPCRPADLPVNEISSLTENSLSLSTDSLAIPSFILGGNPIACNGHMQWLQNINQLANYPHITDLESLYCQLMNTPTKTFIPLVEARPDQFLCEYDTHCFSAGVASLTPATAR